MQVRMARAALNWTLQDLEKKSGVNKNTISRYEAGMEILTGTLDSIERAFIEGGVIFIGEDKEFGPSVRLRLDKLPAIQSTRKGRKSKTKPK